LAIRRVARLSAILLNTAFNCEACWTSKYMLGDVAQPRSSEAGALVDRSGVGGPAILGVLAIGEQDQNLIEIGSRR
jgi:hypothetical protein